MATRRRRATPSLLDRPLRFNEKLVLNQWILSLFEAENFAKLSEDLKSTELEGYDENNVSLFYHQLTQRLFERGQLSNEILLAYDENIFKHTHRLNERRKDPIRWKYFQYLSLLFTEIYLDRFFSDRDRLLADLNRWVTAFNTDKPTSDQVSAYWPDDLRKIALWSATGSGKTLLMHVNILQYRFYLEKHRRLRDMNRIILLTPNEGLSHQHLKDFRESGLAAELFDPESGSLFAGQTIEIIDIHKLGEEKGEKRVAVESFEGNNLVLVDEGHRGASGEIWKKRRDQLCEKGFSFEYSATFSQAVAAATGDQKKKLTNEYARAIFFDYSYRHFYHDGYGKDYRILNLAEDRSGEGRSTYLAACLLAFYQQLCLFDTKREELVPFLIEKPLWIFVGGSVTKEVSTRDVSDVISIMKFLKDFLGDSENYIKRIDSLIRGTHQLLDAQNHRLFENTFSFLFKSGTGASIVYADILKRIFNAGTTGALHVEQLKGTAGEIALRVGTADPFGVINVGDSTKLYKKCSDAGFVVLQREFSGSLFRDINEPNSTIQVLIGSKKFSEGWSSWRVSTMGLMHVGRGEGSQIIQLFGRGVRLKGYKFGLKRSSRIDESIQRPDHIREVETLNVFGIEADYMEEFKRFLEEEGLPSGDERDEFFLPTFQTLPKTKLKILKLPDGLDFKRDAPKPALVNPTNKIPGRRVMLDWYPKIQARIAEEIDSQSDTALRASGTLKAEHLAFLNWNEIFFELVDFKNDRAWFNLELSHDSLRSLLLDNSWYDLKIPPEQLKVGSFERVRLWQEIATTLLKQYADAFYKAKKAEWEAPKLIYDDLNSDSGNFFEHYRFTIEQSEEQIRARLNQVKEFVDKRDMTGKDFAFSKMDCIFFEQHLYQPLIYLKSALVKVSPVHLNEGERDFVYDLKSFYQSNQSFFVNKELYLLRNRSKSGIGFFQAGNFYPDFILWLIDGEKQFVSFVDPKGLRNLSGGINNPKIQFYAKIKEIEKPDLNPNIVLNAFIVTPTRFSDPGWWSGQLTKAEFESQHVFFQVDDKETYISKLLGAIH
jgi:hypothetical protein